MGIALEDLLRFQAANSPDVAAARSNLDSYGRLLPLGPGMVAERVNISRHDGTVLPAYWITPPGYNNKTILFYLHGGGFIAGSFTSHGGSVAELARRAGAKGLFVEYRLAPEHPFPAPVEDAITAYKWLVYDQKVAANRTVFVGDSAGGGLVLLALLALQDEDKGTIPAPAAAVTMSAVTDLSADRPSYLKNAESDVLVKEAFITWAASQCTNTRPEDRAARKSHKVSPIFAAADKIAKLPPLYMSVGESEVLHDDTAHFAGKALQAGGDVKLVTAPFMQHVFPYFYHFVPESDRELTHMANWVKKQQQKI